MAIVDPLQPSLPTTQRLRAAASSIPGAVARLAPGLVLCGAVTLAALLLERIEAGLFGHAWLEALVLAILVGALVRTLWSPSQRWTPGISFSAKTLLEIAVVLLGASVSVGAIVTAGPVLLLGIAVVVVVAIAASYGLGRLLGLPHRMAVLVACGNSICGNSAIAAVAPVIGADGKEVAASIAFTAVLGVLVVLGLPFLPALLQISEVQYGVLAGLTVYAVPQVLAATAPIGAIALQLGTLVKLVRVLMLGPMILVLTLVTRRRTDGAAPAPTRRMPWHKLVPWFIDGFLLLAVLRSFGLLPEAVLAPAAAVATWLTVLSMAALGLSTDLGSVAKAGGRVTAAVTLSLLVLGAISFGLIRLLGIV
ncbi:YeiH family protein [Inquilinus limosus]|uniref:YeiH family protein n=1 Tax=Inquilinus limosus TaxID=171674 RepID=UPI0003F6AED4|nr:YeiH family protein [Inquilinus limosus]